MSVFIIAEAGSSHDNDLQKAYRLIEAAKECGADAVKFQWTSNPEKMALRRGLGQAAADMYRKYLCKPMDWLYSLHQKAHDIGIEFMCSTFLLEDVATIAAFVKRFKISAFESQWISFIEAHREIGKPVICSLNANMCMPVSVNRDPWSLLYCVSEYPTPLEHLHLKEQMYQESGIVGFSDHTANVITGAAAVAAGAKIIESHIRLEDTSPDNPDYPHSLVADAMQGIPDNYMQYVRNIRTVERML